jgi:putative oxidoreductase
MNAQLRETLEHVGLLVLRVVFSALMIVNHGWGKLTSFSEKHASFADPIGLGPSVSMALAVVGEFVAPLFLIVGFGTRIAAVPAAITMFVAAFITHSDSILDKGEKALLFGFAFLVVGLCGPGKYSLDARRKS